MSLSYQELLEKGILIAPDLLDEDLEPAREMRFDDGLLLLNKDVLQALKEKGNFQANWLDFEKALFFKDKRNDDRFYSRFLEYLRAGDSPNIRIPEVKVMFNYAEKAVKRTAADFTSYFNQRYKALERMLKSRAELQGLTSISRLRGKKERETASIIGLVLDKKSTKNQNIMLTMEDQTGTITVLISKNREDLHASAGDVVLDEVLGISGTMGKDMLYANNLVFTDVPLDKELKKAKEEVYAAFLGDPHYGSKFFLKKEFERFVSWIRGESGSEEQKGMASKTKYLFVLGDLVEGVGVYPGQQEDLEIEDIRQQYADMAEYLKQIPKHIQIIIIPGNHDAGRMSEPQAALEEDFAAPVTHLPNVKLLSNPALVNIEASEDFPGFNVLLYHGYSLIYYADNVESIRLKGGQKRADLIMQLLLKKRHLAPTHTSNMYIPDAKKDTMVIEQVPDIFATGHIHRVAAKNYRNITLLNCSCWCDITEDQEKRGLEPQPGKLPVVNLQTREVKIMNFMVKEK